jgi:hypothetical protein
MNEDFVPFELAVKLKDKGFDYKCYYCYKNSIIMSHCSEPLNHNGDAVTYSAPAISQVLKWLRNEKKIHIVIDFDGGMSWYYQIALYGLTTYEKESEHKYNSYEQAALAGIEYVLNNLI